LKKRAVLLSVVALVSVLVLRVGDSLGGGRIGGGIFTGNSPSIGQAVSLKAARALIPRPIPVLPAFDVADPCRADKTTTVRLLQTWADPVDVAAPMRSYGATYSPALIFMVHPATSLADHAIDDGELARVGDAFDPNDFPDGLRDGIVRGHRAWIRERDRSPVCRAEFLAGAPSPGPSARPGDSHADLGQAFPVEERALLSWIENGMWVGLSGPFTAAELTSFAERIEWLT
jgi:hypothetical protein